MENKCIKQKKKKPNPGQQCRRKVYNFHVLKYLPTANGFSWAPDPVGLLV
jgi:hypothetical protein